MRSDPTGPDLRAHHCHARNHLWPASNPNDDRCHVENKRRFQTLKARNSSEILKQLEKTHTHKTLAKCSASFNRIPTEICDGTSNSGGGVEARVLGECGYWACLKNGLCTFLFRGIRWHFNLRTLNKPSCRVGDVAGRGCKRCCKPDDWFSAGEWSWNFFAKEHRDHFPENM